MKVLYAIMICLCTVFVIDSSCYAAFPVTNTQAQEVSVAEVVSATTEQSPTPTALATKKKHRHYHNHEEQPEKYDLSVASFVLALCSIISLSFAVGTIATVLGVLGIILAVLAFIIATQALNRKQKLQGLAIFGLIIGGVISLTFIATIIPKLIGSK
ncbi:hypothetical protein CJD36_009595 [Flavipsychrobacter stenotrophus]|uniref:DUF4190 domain-containing protein n=1 Tax=Flavipsychrobacter stenotrophus TaxID=2077091 RepID=A0A2S7SZJ6_9BACT|nr:hypothetical protein [Flavipsychrobacter stenotrophus]PQJ12031.1 hypothetical protein CJD36_009595 [Flavipsychrobacter stenotrophus]